MVLKVLKLYRTDGTSGELSCPLKPARSWKILFTPGRWCQLPSFAAAFTGALPVAV